MSFNNFLTPIQIRLV